MRVFVGEYVCGGGWDDADGEAATELRAEGSAMLRAIASDLSEVAEIVVPIDARLRPEFDGLPLVEVDPQRPLWAQWVQAAERCDSALVVAPESDGVLAKAVAVLRAAGVDVLASNGDFLRIASDKLLTARTLIAAGIPHPPYVSRADRRFEKRILKNEKFNSGKFVVKPRDGCGTQGIRLFEGYDTAFAQLDEQDLLQPWISGEPISIALVSSGSTPIFLPAVRQLLSEDKLEYGGGCGPADEEVQRRAISLASRVVAEMPPHPRGFVGIDMVIGDRPSQDVVIEINSRLTTSYVGLRKLVRGNLAARLFDLETGPVVCESAVDSVRWNAAGTVWVDDMVAEGR